MTRACRRAGNGWGLQPRGATSRASVTAATRAANVCTRMSLEANIGHRARESPLEGKRLGRPHRGLVIRGTSVKETETGSDLA